MPPGSGRNNPPGTPANASFSTSENDGSITAGAADELIEVVMGYLPGVRAEAHRQAPAATDHLNNKNGQVTAPESDLQRVEPARNAPDRWLGPPGGRTLRSS